MAKLSKRDVRILAAVTIALGAFQRTGEVEGAADVSHLGEGDLARAERLMETLSAEDIATALAETERDIEAVSSRRPS